MNEQILKDFVATAQKYNYDWAAVLGKFPELANYDPQVLKDYVATSENNNYNWGAVNSKFPELFGEQAAQQSTKTSGMQMSPEGEAGGMAADAYKRAQANMQAAGQTAQAQGQTGQETAQVQGQTGQETAQAQGQTGQAKPGPDIADASYLFSAVSKGSDESLSLEEAYVKGKQKKIEELDKEISDIENSLLTRTQPAQGMGSISTGSKAEELRLKDLRAERDKVSKQTKEASDKLSVKKGTHSLYVDLDAQSFDAQPAKPEERYNSFMKTKPASLDGREEFEGKSFSELTPDAQRVVQTLYGQKYVPKEDLERYMEQNGLTMDRNGLQYGAQVIKNTVSASQSMIADAVYAVGQMGGYTPYAMMNEAALKLQAGLITKKEYERQTQEIIKNSENDKRGFYGGPDPSVGAVNPYSIQTNVSSSQAYDTQKGRIEKFKEAFEYMKNNAPSADDVLKMDGVPFSQGGDVEAFTEVSQRIKAMGSDLVDTNPKYQADWLNSVGAPALGSYLTALGVGAVNPQLGTALFTLSGYGSAYQEALEAGETDPDQLRLAATIGGALEATEILPIGNMFDALKLHRVGWGFLKSAGSEVIQEVGVQVGNNLTARELYDSSRTLTDGVWDSGTGAMFTSILTFAFGTVLRKARGVETRDERAARLERLLEEEMLGNLNSAAALMNDNPDAGAYDFKNNIAISREEAELGTFWVEGVDSDEKKPDDESKVEKPIRNQFDFELEQTEPSIDADTMDQIPDDWDIVYQGMHGRLKRTSDGYFLVNEDGKSILIEGGMSGQKPSDIGVLLKQPVSKAAVRAFMVDRKDGGNYELDYQGERYFVTLNSRTNPDEFGDRVFRIKKDGSMVEVYYGEKSNKSRKLAIVNRALDIEAKKLGITIPKRTSNKPTPEEKNNMSDYESRKGEDADTGEGGTVETDQDAGQGDTEGDGNTFEFRPRGGEAVDAVVENGEVVDVVSKDGKPIPLEKRASLVDRANKKYKKQQKEKNAAKARSGGIVPFSSGGKKYQASYDKDGTLLDITNDDGSPLNISPKAKMDLAKDIKEQLEVTPEEAAVEDEMDTKPQPKKEAPKAEAPKAEAPKAEAPKASAPKAEAPKASATDILDRVPKGELVPIEELTSGDSNKDPVVNAVLAKVKEVFSKIKVSGKRSSEGAAFYNVNTKEIDINKNSSHWKEVGGDGIGAAIAHEYTHRAIDQADNAGDIERVLAEIKQDLIDNPPPMSDKQKAAYGFMTSKNNSPQEILAYAISNPEVRPLLEKHGLLIDEMAKQLFGLGIMGNQNQKTNAKEKPGVGSRKIGKNTPLEGAPSVPGINGPDPQIVAVAEKYAKENGIDLKRQAEYAKVDPERAKRIADAYEKMKHDPKNKKVKKAYEELIKQTIAQYKALADAGYQFWFMDLNIPENEEYASSPFNALRDLRNNKQMGVFPTTDGFGTSDLDVDDNPMLQETGIMWPVGGPNGEMKPVLANDLFRAVHDAFGHGMEGAGFRARGEENAWQAHIRLFTGLAKGAITSETRGQNSWLNYGPHGGKNRTAKVEDTVFADQKTGLMPEWTWTEGVVGDMESDGQDQLGPNVPQQQGKGKTDAGGSDVRVTPDNKDAILDALERLKIDTNDLGNEIYSSFIPITGKQAAQLWNAAVSVMQRLVKAGRTLASAINAAISFLKEKGLEVKPKIMAAFVADKVRVESGVFRPKNKKQLQKALVATFGLTPEAARHDAEAMDRIGDAYVNLGFAESKKDFYETFLPGLTTEQMDEFLGAKGQSLNQPSVGLPNASRASTSDMFDNPDALPVDRMENGRTRVLSFAQALDKRARELGYHIPRPTRSNPWNQDQIFAVAKAMADDVEIQLREDSSGIGWYDTKIKSAMELMSRLHPELADKEGAMHLKFHVILAITSQGNAVDNNFQAANKAYTAYKKTGKLPNMKYPGKSGPTIKQKLDLSFTLIDKLGVAGFKEVLAEEKTVKEWKELGYKVTGELVTERITGAMAIMGSKIGSFYGNLNGDYSTLTADLWFSRTFGRITGNTVALSNPESAEKTVRERLRSYKGKDVLFGYEKSDILNDEDIFDEWVEVAYKAYVDSGYTAKNPILVSVNTMVKNRVGKVQDVPKNGAERSTMRKAISEVQNMLIQRGYPKIEIADLQAILWYNEKDLYSQYKAANKTAEKSDYETAAQNILIDNKIGAEVAPQFQRGDTRTEASIRAEREASKSKSRRGSGSNRKSKTTPKKGGGRGRSAVKTLNQDGESNTRPRAQIDIARRVITAMSNPDAASPLHEISHAFFDDMLMARIKGNKAAEKIYERFLEFANSSEGRRFWSTQMKGKFDLYDYTFQQELFASGLERFIFDNEVKAPILSHLFNGIKEFLENIFQDILSGRLDIKLSPKMKEVYSVMMGQDMKELLDMQEELIQEQIAQADATVVLLAESIVAAHKAEKGSSIAMSGESLAGKDLFSVSVFPSRSVLLDGPNVTREDIISFIEANSDLLTGSKALFVGTWFDSDTGQSVIDVTTALPLKEATYLGKKYNQKAIFSLKDFKEIPVGGTGTPLKAMPRLETTLREINHLIPKNTKLDQKQASPLKTFGVPNSRWSQFVSEMTSVYKQTKDIGSAIDTAIQNLVNDGYVVDKDAIKQYMEQKLDPDNIKRSTFAELRRDVKKHTDGYREGAAEMKSRIAEVKGLISEWVSMNSKALNSSGAKLTSVAVNRINRAKTMNDAMGVLSYLQKIVDDSEFAKREELRIKTIDRIMKIFDPDRLILKDSGTLKGRRFSADDIDLATKVFNEMKNGNRLTSQQRSNELANDLANGFISSTGETITPEMEDAMRNELFILQFSDISMASQGEADAMLQEALDFESGAKQKKDAEVQRKAKERSDFRDEAIDILTDKGGAPLRRIVGAKDRFMDWVTKEFDWHTMLDRLSIFDKSTGTNGSILNRKFGAPVSQAEYHEARETMVKTKHIHKKMKEVLLPMAKRMYPAKAGSRIFERAAMNALMRDNASKRIPISYTDTAGNQITEEFTQNELAYVYALLKDPENAAGMKFKDANGDWILKGDEFKNSVEAALAPEMKAWADYLQNEWFNEMYDYMAPIYKEMYHLNMPRHADYIPRKVTGLDVNVSKSISLFDDYRIGNVYNSATKARVKHNQQLAVMDINDVARQHLSQSLRFKNWALIVKEMSIFFNNAGVRKAIGDHHGHAYNHLISASISIWAGGRAAATGDKLVSAMRNNMTRATLAFKPAIAVYQLINSPAYLAYIPMASYLRRSGSITKTIFSKQARENIKHIIGSDYMKQRFSQGDAFEIMELMNSASDKFSKSGFGFNDLATILTKAGDAGAIIIGGYPVFEHFYSEQKKKGLSDARAREYAMDKLADATEQLQQSGFSSRLAFRENMNPMAKLFTMFMSQPRQYHRLVTASVRNLKEGRGDWKAELKRAVVLHVLMPSLFQLAANGFDWDWEDQVAAAALGNLHSYFIVGQLAQMAVWGAMGRDAFDINSPVTSALSMVGGAFTKVDKYISSQDPESPDYWEGEDTFDMFYLMMRGTAPLHGLPVGAAGNIIRAETQRAEEGYVYRPTMRRLGWSAEALEHTNKAEAKIDEMKRDLGWQEIVQEKVSEGYLEPSKEDYAWDKYKSKWYTVDAMAREKAKRRWLKEFGGKEDIEKWEYDPEVDAMVRKEQTF